MWPFKKKEMLPQAPILVWEPLMMKESGVSVTWVTNDSITINAICDGIWESQTRYMLTRKDKPKQFINKEDIISIEVQ